MRRRRIVLDVRRSGDLFAEEIVISVEKAGDIHVNVVPQQSAVTQLVAVQFFRLEASISVETRKEGQSIWRDANKSSKEKIFLHARRRTHRSRSRQPYRLRVRRRPQQPAAWFRLDARVIRLQKFRADLESQALRHQRNIVLYESGVELVGLRIRIEVKAADNGRFIAMAGARSQTPGKVIARSHKKSLQKIDVKIIANIFEVRLRAVGPVVIRLHLNIRALAKRPGPASQNISAGKIFASRDHLRVRRRVRDARDRLAGALVV